MCPPPLVEDVSDGVTRSERASERSRLLGEVAATNGGAIGLEVGSDDRDGGGVAGQPISTPERELLTQGAGEIDFVRTALEETTAVAYEEIREVWKRRALPELRTAAFLVAIERVGNCYVSQGIFP